jgi:hypothetical protein
MSLKRFSKPTEVTQLDIAFGGDMQKLMPSMLEIPAEFKRGNLWTRFQARWFFNGLKGKPKARDGIDQSTALRHLAAIQGSFEPKHEHKEAAVAYLASLWLDENSVKDLLS